MNFNFNNNKIFYSSYKKVTYLNDNFNNVIPIVSKIFYVFHSFFTIDEFTNLESFKDKIKNTILPNNNYTCYVKLIYNSDNYFMVGNQSGFFYFK